MGKLIALGGFCSVIFLVTSCTSTTIVTNGQHDNGLHKGWYKNTNNPHNPAHNSSNNGNGNNGKGNGNNGRGNGNGNSHGKGH